MFRSCRKICGDKYCIILSTLAFKKWQGNCIDFLNNKCNRCEYPTTCLVGLLALLESVCAELTNFNPLEQFSQAQSPNRVI